MAKIKIISDPYQKNIGYQCWDHDNERWMDITIENNGNSRLINDKFTKSFFPFKVKEIIDEIMEEYHIVGKKTEIVFEGTEDEYKELKELCKDEKYTNTVVLSKSDIFLENARDILPDINEVFNEKLHPLITQSVSDFEKIRKELKKYTDASNDIIPVCVLGNYSSGKSTFINALLGNEILPSGAEPLTAKIYKIQQSPYRDRAYIEFGYDDKPIKLKFDENKCNFNVDINENQLIKKISEKMENLENASLALLVNKALEIINSYDRNVDEKVSDLIEIEVPFIGGLWGESARKFVIFDTPGSNSASNDKHLLVLKRAMEGFSNGLPVFISEFDKLDSTDNENLYREIENIKELDSRFTMIVVNKADAAELDKGGFSKEKEERILGESVPKNLYSGGVYFVSSVMGLGSKNKEDFIDEHYAELYDEKKNKFENASSRFYKMLYRYNIMPEQLKRKAIETAEKCDDLIFANSGLFSVEKDIQTFAGKYSAYNKCQQSQLFLGRVIDITSNEILKAKAEREESKRNRNMHLQNDKRELVDKIESESNRMKEQFIEQYPAHMQVFDSEVNSSFTSEQLKEQEMEIEKRQREDTDFDGRNLEVKEAVDRIKDNLKDGLKDSLKGIFCERKISILKTMGESLVSDIKGVTDKWEELTDAKKEIDKATAEELLKRITSEFKVHFDNAQRKLDMESRQYWGIKTQQTKDELIRIVTGSSALTDEKREELSNIIINYGNIKFVNQAEEIFFSEDFSKTIRLGNLTIVETDKLDIRKLENRYNSEMENKVDDMQEAIEVSHRDSFVNWIESLCGTVIDNIEEYSPMLRSQVQIIKEETEKIVELETKQKQLENYAESIRRMMEWKMA